MIFQCPVVLRYQIAKTTKSAAEYHLESSSGDYILPDRVRLEIDQGYSRATGVCYWFKVRNTSNWAKCARLTALRRFADGVYYGDWINKSRTRKRLLIFRLTETNLVVEIYPGYPKNRSAFLDKYGAA